jgi:hypothetical protein
MEPFLPDRAGPGAGDDEVLRSALAGTVRQLWHLPAGVEAAFRQYCRARAASLLRQAVLWLLALHMLVLIPLVVHRDDPSLQPWLTGTTIPVLCVLIGLWLCTRLSDLEEQVNLVICLAAGVALAAMLQGSMHLEGRYFGDLAQYETLYVMLIILVVLPPRLALPTTLAAAGAALVITWLRGGRIDWLEIQLYFSVPLVICTVIGFILEHSERRSFVQQLLMQRESARLADLHVAAEANIRRQRYEADFLALINGNHSLHELFTRTLRFLVDHTGAQVAAAYHLSTRGKLRRVAAWGMAGASLEARREIEPEGSLMGPALKTGELLHLRRIPADYLPVDLGMGRLPCAALLVIPVVQAGKPLAVIELGRINVFSDEDCARAEAIRTHLAYAVAAANAREIGVRAATA